MAMKQRLRAILEYLSAFVLIILLLFSIAGLIVVKFYGDDLKVHVMEEINVRLDTKVDVDEISVKVFQKFPNTSIQLKNVTLWSSHNFSSRYFDGPGADTLLHAEDVNVSFNLIGLIRKKYNIRQLEVKKGVLHLYTDGRGEINYQISSNEDKEKKDDSPVNLSNLRIIDFGLVVNNQAKQLISTGSLKRLDLNGRFSKRSTQIKGALSGHLGEISNKGILYSSDREIQAGLSMDVSDSLYNIKSGQIQIDRIVADMDGHFLIHEGSGVEMDLIAEARNLEIHEVLDLLPSKFTNTLKGIKGNGNLELYVRTTGIVSATLTPSIEADFQTSNADLSWDRLPFSIKNLNLSGTYSNGGRFNPLTTSLSIESLSALIGTDHVTLNGRIHNFYDPDFSFKLKGDIHPDQWLKWYEEIPIYRAKGTVISDMKVKGSYDRLKPPGEKFLALDFSGGLALEDVLIMINEKGAPFSDLNGTIHIDNDFWEPSFSGSFGSSDFNFYGSGHNLLSFLMKEEETLVASATLRTNRFDLREILDNFPKTNSGHNSSVFFPELLNLRLDFVINEFFMDKFKAEDMRGIATYDAPFFFVDSLTMQTMEGTLRGDYRMAQDTEGDIFMNVNASLYKLNISQLFYSFNNFGQEQITHENLKGSISGTGLFSAGFDTTFSLRPQSILSENNIKIKDGELNSFDPIMALSRFIEVDELRNIQFETLENNILIKEGQVIIPSMNIQSNALNLQASGTHAFNNHYDYRLMLKLSELLYNKARGARNSEFNIAVDDSDTRVLFLKVYDNGSGTKVEMDREKTAEKIRKDLIEEKIELKQVLNQELGLFKHDDNSFESKELGKEEDETFTFDFTEESDSIEVEEKKEKGFWRRKKVDKGKKDSIENKPAVEFVIDE